jgi:hypothetical protein
MRENKRKNLQIHVNILFEKEASLKKKIFEVEQSLDDIGNISLLLIAKGFSLFSTGLKLSKLHKPSFTSNNFNEDSKELNEQLKEITAKMEAFTLKKKKLIRNLQNIEEERKDYLKVNLIKS